MVPSKASSTFVPSVALAPFTWMAPATRPSGGWLWVFVSQYLRPVSAGCAIGSVHWGIRGVGVAVGFTSVAAGGAVGFAGWVGLTWSGGTVGISIEGSP